MDNSNYTIYQLKPAQRNQFLKALIKGFRVCYISDNFLNKRSSKLGCSLSEFLEKYIIPDDPIIKSGDFGELLSYYLVKENYSKKGMVLIAPKKWKWKDDRNKAMHYSDAIMFYLAGKKYSNKDILISVESKMKSVKSKENRIQDAIDGAVKDKLSRLAKTLNWMEEKYAKLGKVDKVKLLQRFKDPATYGSFEKAYKAFAILDKSFEADEIAMGISNDENIIVIIVSIDDLKTAYEETRTNIIKSV